jgi:tetratricopeptide (TPR) repeat protein
MRKMVPKEKNLLQLKQKKFNNYIMIKHYLFGLFAVACMAQPAIAQDSKVTTAWGYINSKDYDKARDAINIAITNDRTKNEARTWFYRGEAYQGIFSDPKMNAKEPDALKESAQSYRKAIALDLKNRYPEAKDNLITVALLMFNEGLKSYSAKKYAEALDKFNEFETSYNALGDSKKKIDAAFAGTNPPTDIREVKLYMAGCAIQLDQKDKAKQLFQELIDSKFPNTAVYINLAKYQMNDKDTAKAYETLDKGIKDLPEDIKGAVLIEKLKLLIRQGRNADAIKVGEDALAHDPNNISLYNALGKMYAEQKNYDKAIAIYNKAMTIDAKNFGIVSGLGVIKFNQGVDQYNEYVNSKSKADQDKYLIHARDIWRDAIKDLEGALNLPHDKPTDREDLKATYDALSQMYYKLQDPVNGKKYRELYNK